MMKLENTLQNIRIDNAVLELLKEFKPESAAKYTRSKIQKMIEEKKIRVNSKPVKSSLKVKEGDIIEIEEPLADSITEIPAPENIKLDIVYEDESFLVINKPKNMLTHPTALNKTGTLVNALLYYGCPLSGTGGKERPGIVHRLDKNTSGLIMVAKTDTAHQNLQEQIRNKSAKRRYLAVVHGIMENDSGIIDKPLVHYMSKTVKMNVADTGLRAVTRYRVVKRYDDISLIELELETGRTHQIRVHLASLNHPVYNDTLYGAKGFKSKLKLKTTEQLLTSYYLRLKHPLNGNDMEFRLEKNRFDSDFQNFFKITETSTEDI